MADSSQNVLRRRPTATVPASSNTYGDDTTPRSPFSDDEGYVVVSGHPYAEDITPYRPSLGGYSDHVSDADHGRLSYDPLLPTPSNQFARYDQPTTEAERRLLTLNELNPVERANLVRQSRKLNKILGTTPHIAEMTQSSSPRIAPNRLQRRGTLAGSDIRYDRNASMATLSSPPLEAPAGSQWSKTASSLVAASSPSTANSNIPLLRLNVAPSSGDMEDTKRARRLSDSSIASSFISITAPRRSSSNRLARPQPTTDSVDDNQAASSPGAPNTLRPDAGIYMPPSPTSPPYASDSVRRQQTRARMAKLQQIMGESVPSELVIGATPNSNIRRRRLSMESPTTPTAAATKALKHKRSKSLWRKDVNDNFEFDSAPENSFPGKGHSKSKSREMPPIEDLLRKQLQTPLNEKQKALNVKRALKMAAVFGVPPPSTLYQESSFPMSSSSFDPSASRQSLTSLAYMLDHDRDSLYDLLSSIADSDSESDEDPVEWPYEHKPRTDSLPEARSQPLSSTTSMGAAKYSVAGRHPDMAPPTPPFSNHANSNANTKPILRQPLPTYSTSMSTVAREDGKAKQPPSSSLKKKPSSAAIDQQFTSRRRRAKKLSRFFGVGYNELFNTLIYEDALSDRPEPKSEAPLLPLPVGSLGAEVAKVGRLEHRAAAAPSAYRGTGRGGTVMVQTDNGKKTTVLRTSTNVAADVGADEVGEMMAKLRALRA